MIKRFRFRHTRLAHLVSWLAALSARLRQAYAATKPGHNVPAEGCSGRPQATLVAVPISEGWQPPAAPVRLPEPPDKAGRVRGREFRLPRSSGPPIRNSVPFPREGPSPVRSGPASRPRLLFPIRNSEGLNPTPKAACQSAIGTLASPAPESAIGSSVSRGPESAIAPFGSESAIGLGPRAQAVSGLESAIAASGSQDGAAICQGLESAIAYVASGNRGPQAFRFLDPR